MFNNSVFLKHGICDTVTVFLMLLPSLWIQEWAIGKGLYLLAQTNLQLLNASVQDCTWHCALWTVTFQKRISLKHVGLWSSVSSHLPSGSMRAQQRWWSQPGTGDVEPLTCPVGLQHWGWCAVGWDRAGCSLWGCGWSWRITSSAVHQGEVLKIYYWILLLFTTGFNLFLNTVS